MRSLLVISFSALLLAPAAAQEQWTREAEDLRDDFKGELYHYRDAPGDLEARALCAVRLLSWLAEHGEEGRWALDGVELSEPRDALDLLGALQQAPAVLPDLHVLPANREALAAALAAPPGDLLADALGYLRFTDALDRAGDVDATLEALAAPEHRWVVAVRGALARRAAVEEFAGALDQVGHPDVTTATRVRVTYLTENWIGSYEIGDHIDERLGWLRRSDESGVEIFCDTLRPEIFNAYPVPLELRELAGGPLPRIEPVDVDAECARWLLAPEDAHRESSFEPGALWRRPAILVHATWALRRGRPLLACHLVRLAELDDYDTLELVMAEGRLAIAEGHWELAIEALQEGAARRDQLPRLDLVISLLPIEFEVDVDLVMFMHEKATALRAQLEVQAAEEALDPPPSWATWQAWSPAERLASALAHLRDQDAIQQDHPGGCDPLNTVTPFPRDAPRGDHGDSVGHRLIELGEIAIPALVELITDPRPSRCAETNPWQVVSLGWVAMSVLDEMLGSGAFQDIRERDPEVRAARFQEQARAWLRSWGDPGGLGAWHHARILSETDPGAQASHARALARYDPERARDVLPGLFEKLRDATLLRALAETRDPAYAALFRAELDTCEVEAALGLVGLGDEPGAARVCDVVRRGYGDWLDLLARLARAGAPDAAGRLLLERTSAGSVPQPWDQEELDHGSFLPVDEALALTRLIAHHQNLWSERFLETLRRTKMVAGPREHVIVDALCVELDAFVERVDRREHAAATVLSLGLDAVTRFEAAGGPAIRTTLLAALRSGAPQRAAPFDDALGRAGPTAAAWAIEGADDVTRELVRAACVRASLFVRGVDELWGEGRILSQQVSSRFGLESVAQIISSWRAEPGMPALELTIERVADLGGVVLRARSRETIPAHALDVHVRAPGLERDGAAEDLEPVVKEFLRALEHAPEAQATMRVLVAR